MNNKLFFTGTETTHIFSGYMEGSIIASNSIATKVSKIIKK
jgi:monoamine oxidase